MNFVHDQLDDGRKFFTLMVIGQCWRESVQ